MFSELDYRVVVADFDPQANLSEMLLGVKQARILV